MTAADQLSLFGSPTAKRRMRATYDPAVPRQSGSLADRIRRAALTGEDAGAIWDDAVTVQAAHNRQATPREAS